MAETAGTEPPGANRELVAEGRHLDFWRTAGRGWEFVSRKGSRGVVGIVAVDEERRVLLVEQWREPVAGLVVELPAGIAGDEGDPDEPLLAAAQRELREETGCVAEEWQELGAGCSSAGLTDEMIVLFLATHLRQVEEREVYGVGQERIRLHRVPGGRLNAFLQERQAAGSQVDFKVYAGVLLAAAKLDNAGA